VINNQRKMPKESWP